MKRHCNIFSFFCLQTDHDGGQISIEELSFASSSAGYYVRMVRITLPNIAVFTYILQFISPVYFLTNERECSSEFFKNTPKGKSQPRSSPPLPQGSNQLTKVFTRQKRQKQGI